MMRKRGYEQQPFTQRDEWTWANAVRNTCTNIRRLHKHEHRQARKTAPQRNFPGGANRSNKIVNEAVTPQRVAVETFSTPAISLTQRKRRLQPIGLLNSKGGVYTPHPWTSKGGDTSANLANQTDQTSNVASNVKRWVEISHNTCVERVCWIKYNSIRASYDAHENKLTCYEPTTTTERQSGLSTIGRRTPSRRTLLSQKLNSHKSLNSPKSLNAPKAQSRTKTPHAYLQP